VQTAGFFVFEFLLGWIAKPGGFVVIRFMAALPRFMLCCASLPYASTVCGRTPRLKRGLAVVG
jgi:hypothetical protein